MHILTATAAAAATATAGVLQLFGAHLFLLLSLILDPAATIRTMSCTFLLALGLVCM